MPVDLDSGPLGEVLLAAQKRMEPQGRIIVEVLLDGRTIVGDELVDRQNEAIDDATLNLLTANPRELVIDTLGETHRMLEAAGEQQAEAADALQRDDEATALERIGEAMTIWQQTERAVSESAMIMEISLDSLRVDDMTFSELTAELISSLTHLRELLKARDTVAVADTLQYEWPAINMRWQKAIEKLMERVGPS